MATFLLTWNPKRWPWDDLRDAADAVAERGGHVERWSCGNTRRIERGDRVFLLRQGQEPRGIVASGTVVEAPYPAEHWDRAREGPAWYVNVEFDALQDPETAPILPRERLNAAEFAGVYWDAPASGFSIPTAVAKALEREWATVVGRSGEPEGGMTGEPGPLYEGASRAVTLSVFERNPEARWQCIAHYGAMCAVCGIDFGKTYGPEAQGYIHVHHLRPVAELGERYAVDPIEDLRPVCPNCHAVVHRRTPPYTLDEVRQMLQTHAHP